MPQRASIAAACLAVALASGCAALGERRHEVSPSPEQLALRRQLSQDAQTAIDRGDWATARMYLERLVVLAPRSAEALNRLGQVLEAQGALPEAEATYRKALSLDSEYADALMGLAQVEARLGRGSQALAHIDAAIEIAPGRSEAHLIRGRILEVNGRTDDALAAYFLALAHDSSSAAAMFRVAVIQLDRNQVDQALVRLSHVLELTPESPEAHHQRGRAHLALGHLDAAIEDLRIASDRLPQRADVYYDLALALERASRYDDARQAADRALTLAPDFAGARDLSRRLKR